MPKQLWFKSKRYGWGWTPSTWQGWAILVMYLFAVVPDFIFIDKNLLSISDVFILFFPKIFILTAFLIIICYLTGEKPRWRWGDTDESK